MLLVIRYVETFDNPYSNPAEMGVEILVFVLVLLVALPSPVFVSYGYEVLLVRAMGASVGKKIMHLRIASTRSVPARETIAVGTLNLRWLVLIAPNSVLFPFGIYYLATEKDVFGGGSHLIPFSHPYLPFARIGMAYLMIGSVYVALLVVTTLRSKSRRGLHDLAARTVVVDARSVSGVA